MKRKTAKKIVAATLALAIATTPALSWSGWVDDWMSQKTSTSPSYYEGAKRGYYTGGSFSARWPNGTDYPVTVTMPSVKSGCGGIDAGLLKGNSDSAANLDGLADDVETGNAHGPRRRHQERGQDADRGRLAGTVWPQQTVDLSRSDLE